MRLCRLGLLTVTFTLLACLSSASASERHVDVITLNADINPVTANYVTRAIDQANADGASAVVIELDTPGGDLGSMKTIIQKMEASRVPTIVYVYPEGAWAGSAGTFITVAADVAAMAPGTTIGAASPVGSGGSNLPSTEKKKVTNFATSYIAGLARDHGHNPGFAVQAVTNAKALTYQQALDRHVINFVAPDLRSLLNMVDGYRVRLPTGVVTFHTAGAAINKIDMSFSENLLLILTDPNLVLILMSVGTLAIIFELTNPGAILPGIVGVICLAIGLYALGTIPINATGLVLMAFAFLLFIADLKMPTHGFLTVGGMIAFALGAILLFSPSGANGGPSVSLWTVAFVTLLLGAFFAFAVTMALRAQQWSVKTGIKAMIGSMAVTQTRLTPEGSILLDGARWRAVSDHGDIDSGREVLVKRIDGLTVHVAPAEEDALTDHSATSTRTTLNTSATNSADTGKSL